MDVADVLRIESGIIGTTFTVVLSFTGNGKVLGRYEATTDEEVDAILDTITETLASVAEAPAAPAPLTVHAAPPPKQQASDAKPRKYENTDEVQLKTEGGVWEVLGATWGGGQWAYQIARDFDGDKPKKTRHVLEHELEPASVTPVRIAFDGADFSRFWQNEFNGKTYLGLKFEGIVSHDAMARMKRVNFRQSNNPQVWTAPKTAASENLARLIKKVFRQAAEERKQASAIVGTWDAPLGAKGVDFRPGVPEFKMDSVDAIVGNRWNRNEPRAGVLTRASVKGGELRGGRERDADESHEKHVVFSVLKFGDGVYKVISSHDGKATDIYYLQVEDHAPVRITTDPRVAVSWFTPATVDPEWQAWARGALEQLKDASPDGVAVKNDVGFSGSTLGPGLWLLGLLQSGEPLYPWNVKQIKEILTFHRKQVGTFEQAQDEFHALRGATVTKAFHTVHGHAGRGLMEGVPDPWVSVSVHFGRGQNAARDALIGFGFVKDEDNNYTARVDEHTTAIMRVLVPGYEPLTTEMYLAQEAEKKREADERRKAQEAKTETDRQREKAERDALDATLDTALVIRIDRMLDARGLPTQGRTAKSIAAAIQTGKFQEILSTHNEASREIFSELTGVKLPKTIKGTKELFVGKPFNVKPGTQEKEVSPYEKAQRIAASTGHILWIPSRGISASEKAHLVSIGMIATPTPNHTGEVAPGWLGKNTSAVHEAINRIDTTEEQ